MNKTELIASVAQKSELTKKDAEKAVKAVFEAVSETLKKAKKFRLSVSVHLKFVSAKLAKAATPATIR